jgi:uracil-DNA glycosylase family 4
MLSGPGRTQVVFGVGNPSADLMFVGEAPGPTRT